MEGSIKGIQIWWVETGNLPIPVTRHLCIIEGRFLVYFLLRIHTHIVSVCVAAYVVCVFVCVDTRMFIWRPQVDVQRLPQLFSALSTEVETSFPPHPELLTWLILLASLLEDRTESSCPPSIYTGRGDPNSGLLLVGKAL